MTLTTLLISLVVIIQAKLAYYSQAALFAK